MGLKLSAGTISTALRDLRFWGVVRTVTRPGKRAEHFTAETNLLPAILKVFRERELELIRRTIAVLEDTRTRALKRSNGASTRALSGFVEHRLAQLLGLARLGHAALSSLVDLRAPDFELLRRALKLD